VKRNFGSIERVKQVPFHVYYIRYKYLHIRDSMVK